MQVIQGFGQPILQISTYLLTLFLKKPAPADRMSEFFLYVKMGLFFRPEGQVGAVILVNNFSGCVANEIFGSVHYGEYSSSSAMRPVVSWMISMRSKHVLLTSLVESWLVKAL